MPITDASSAAIPVDAPLAEQSAYLFVCVSRSAPLFGVLEALQALSLPEAYLAAGCLAQTVWNARWGRSLERGIKDLDVVYCDPHERGREVAETIEKALARVTDLPLDVNNQAQLGFSSTAAAIATWPATASAVALGLQREVPGYSVCAPFGLRDLLAGHVRRNPASPIDDDAYAAKVARWREEWPELTGRGLVRVVGRAP